MKVEQRKAKGKLKEILDNMDEESLAETRRSMLTIEERAKEHFAHNWHGSVIDAYTEGAKDQQKIDEIKYNKLKELAMDMYTAMQYLSTDTRSIREKMEKFHHFIIYESKAMEE